MDRPESYLKSGVDLKAASEAVEKITSIAKDTYTFDVLSGVGPFASLFRSPVEGFSDPILVSSADGVGTKLLLHVQEKTFEEAGIDLVAMCANDILTAGAIPLFFLDYIAGAQLDPEVVSRFVHGMAIACKEIGAALIGGETAEMPGLYKKGDYDLSGFIVGVVDLPKIIKTEMVKPGDLIIGITSSGPHSNGFSLIRKIIADEGLDLNKKYDKLGETLKDSLLAPTRLYHPIVMPLLKESRIHGMANITGGGLVENIPRCIPDGYCAVIDTSSFPLPKIFEFLKEKGRLNKDEMYSVFNMGIGFALIVNMGDADELIQTLNHNKEQAFVIGKITKGKSKIELK